MLCAMTRTHGITPILTLVTCYSASLVNINCNLLVIRCTKFVLYLICIDRKINRTEINQILVWWIRNYCLLVMLWVMYILELNLFNNTRWIKFTSILSSLLFYMHVGQGMLLVGSTDFCVPWNLPFAMEFSLFFWIWQNVIKWQWLTSSPSGRPLKVAAAVRTIHKELDRTSSVVNFVCWSGPVVKNGNEMCHVSYNRRW